MTKTKRQQIANYLGAEKIRVRHGMVEAYGSDDPTDRTQDWWRVAGTVSEIDYYLRREEN